MNLKLHSALLVLLTGALCPISFAQPMLPPATLVNAADYTYDLSPGAIGAIFGERLSTGMEAAQSLPLPTSLGGTSVEASDGVRTALLPLFMVSEGQLNVQIPYGMGPELTIRVTGPHGGASRARYPWSRGRRSSSPGIRAGRGRRLYRTARIARPPTATAR